MDSTKNNNKIENLLVLLFLETIKDASIKEKASKLNMAGFSHAEIASFLNSTTAVIKQSVYMGKKVDKKPAKKAKNAS